MMGQLWDALLKSVGAKLRNKSATGNLYKKSCLIVKTLQAAPVNCTARHGQMVHRQMVCVTMLLRKGRRLFPSAHRWTYTRHDPRVRQKQKDLRQHLRRKAGPPAATDLLAHLHCCKIYYTLHVQYQYRFGLL